MLRLYEVLSTNGSSSEEKSSVYLRKQDSLFLVMGEDTLAVRDLHRLFSKPGKVEREGGMEINRPPLTHRFFPASQETVSRVLGYHKVESLYQIRSPKEKKELCGSRMQIRYDPDFVDSLMW